MESLFEGSTEDLCSLWVKIIQLETVASTDYRGYVGLCIETGLYGPELEPFQKTMAVLTSTDINHSRF